MDRRKKPTGWPGYLATINAAVISFYRLQTMDSLTAWETALAAADNSAKGDERRQEFLKANREYIMKLKTLLNCRAKFIANETAKDKENAEAWAEAISYLTKNIENIEETKFFGTNITKKAPLKPGESDPQLKFFTSLNVDEKYIKEVNKKTSIFSSCCVLFRCCVPQLNNQEAREEWVSINNPNRALI